MEEDVEEAFVARVVEESLDVDREEGRDKVSASCLEYVV